MKHEHTFHQSWIGTFFECPEQARRVRAGTYPVDETEAAAKGTGAHAAIEAVLAHGASREEALQVGVDKFRTIASTEGFRWVQVKREATCLEHIQAGFFSWYEKVLPKLGATLWCEHKFSFVLHEDEQRIITLAGTIDYADRVSGLKDWKLTANQDKYGKREGWKLQRWGVQPTVYAAAAYEAGLYEPDQPVPFDFVAMSPRGGEPQILSCERSEQDISWLREQCVSIAEFIEADLSRWPLRDQSALCSERWCTAWSTCKGQHVDLAA